MTLVRMMYRLIRNQDCDQMELNSHLLLLGHVLGLNDYSAFSEMIKGYRYIARRCHPDNNYGFDTT